MKYSPPRPRPPPPSNRKLQHVITAHCKTTTSLASPHKTAKKRNNIAIQLNIATTCARVPCMYKALRRAAAECGAIAYAGSSAMLLCGFGANAAVMDKTATPRDGERLRKHHSLMCVGTCGPMITLVCAPSLSNCIGMVRHVTPTFACLGARDARVNRIGTPQDGAQLRRYQLCICVMSCAMSHYDLPLSTRWKL